MTQLIPAGAPDDPIARQFVPDVRELEAAPDERPDPISDKPFEVTPGLVHRYPDRVLLKLVGACAVYCRFCFRREMVGPDLGETLSAADIAAALHYIRTTPGIWEVIVSGGDPLVASPRRLARLTEALASIAHVKVVRWHTRVPVVAPERITPELVAALRATGQAVYVALHANHATELTPAARAACARLIDSGIAMVSQTVLLRGVNDDPATLEALFRALVELRIKPYYLHHPDLAPGTGHFRTSIAKGQELMRALRGRTSGLCQPTYVLDLPDGSGKVPIGPSYFASQDVAAAGSGGAHYQITDADGRIHTYCECRQGAVATPPDR